MKSRQRSHKAMARAAWSCCCRPSSASCPGTWESLPAFAPERLSIERAVSLVSWLAGRAGPGPRSFAAHAGQAASAVRADCRVLAADDQTLPLTPQELAAARAYHGASDPRRPTSLHAVLRALTLPGGKHLLAHADYTPDNPWASCPVT